MLLEKVLLFFLCFLIFFSTHLPCNIMYAVLLRFKIIQNSNLILNILMPGGDSHNGRAQGRSLGGAFVADFISLD